MGEKTTLVLGASLKTERYSNKAIRRLRDNNIPTLAIGLKAGTVADVEIITNINAINQPIDTVTLYLNPQRQEEFYDAILKLAPRRVIFNPGTENYDFMRMLNAEGIESEAACTLVLLSMNSY